MIVINARFLTQPITGVQRFAVEISKILKKKLGDKIQFVTPPSILHNKLAAELEAKKIGYNKSHIWEQIDLYSYLLKNNSPLLISFGYTGPLLYKRQIISVHDMAFKYYKETFSRGFSMIYNFMVPKIARRCLHVFTVSNASKKDICKELKISSEKVSVVYNGLTEVFKKEALNSNRINQKEKYLLTVSSHHPRKNYQRLIKAFSVIKDKSLKLYIVGNKISHFSDELGNSSSDYNGRIKFLSNVTDKELVSYYENALLFVFPSLYEGFGIPVIEAMSKGLPCVISDIPVFKEIGDESVIYVDPNNVNSIADGIERGLKLEGKRITYQKLDTFNWENSTDVVIEIINKYKN